jgi:hypothetical protein
LNCAADLVADFNFSLLSARENHFFTIGSREARMHRCNQPTILMAVAGLVALSSGCRNSLPEQQVRMQQSPSTTADGIEEPPYRLQNAFGIGRSRSTAPRTAANQNRSESRSAGDDDAGAAGTSFALNDNERTTASISQQERAMLEKAFADASPEIRQLAERRLAALKANADSSNESVAQSSPNAQAKPQPSAAATEANRAAAESKSESVAQATGSVGAGGVVKPASSSTASTKKTNPEEFTMPIPPAPASASAASPAAAEPAEKSATPAAANPESAIASAPTAEPNKADATAETTEPKAAKTAATEKTAAIASSDKNAAPGDLKSASDQELLRELIARHQQRLAEKEVADDADLSDLIRLRTYLLFDGQLDQATARVEGWMPAELEFLNYHQMAVWHLIDPASHPLRERRWASALPDLRQATNHLAAATGNLQVHNLAFCTAVDGFGKITPFPDNRFAAGDQVILYSEVENFVAERLSDGYETHLRGSYRILDSGGRRIAEQVLAEDQQTCNNYRRDYFLPYILHLPDRLTAGNYRFELTLEDVKGKKYGQASIPFEIEAGTK